MRSYFGTTVLVSLLLFGTGCALEQSEPNRDSDGEAVQTEVDAGKLTDVQFYVASETENKISIIDIVSSDVVGEIETDLKPTIITFASTMRYAYVANQDSSTIQLINTQSLQVEKEVEVGPLPHGLALTPDNRTLYVATVGDQYVDVIDTQEMKVVEPIDLGEGSRSNYPYLDEDGTIFVSDHENSAVYVVDPTTLEVSQTIETGEVPRVVRIVGEHLFVAASEAGQLEQYDKQSGELIRAFEVGHGVTDFVINEDGTMAVTTSMEGNAVSFIDLESGEVTGTMSDLSGAKHLSFNRKETKVYVTLSGSNEVAVIDVESLEVEETIEVGEAPHGIEMKALPGIGGSC